MDAPSYPPFHSPLSPLKLGAGGKREPTKPAAWFHGLYVKALVGEPCRVSSTSGADFQHSLRRRDARLRSLVPARRFIRIAKGSPGACPARKVRWMSAAAPPGCAQGLPRSACGSGCYGLRFASVLRTSAVLRPASPSASLTRFATNGLSSAQRESAIRSSLWSRTTI